MLLASSFVSAATRPNFVVLMADDLDNATLQRARDLGLMPNFDAVLQAGGLRFDESFVSDPLCCPSRATFLTGQYPHNHGVLNITYNSTTPEGSFAAFDDREAINVWLQRAGYHTGLIGKFLNGYGYVPPRNCPACDRMHYVPPGWNDWQGMPDYGELNGSAGVGYAGAYCMYNYSINVNGTLATYHSATSDYQTDVIAQRAGAFVDHAATLGQPFFLYLAPLVPHYELCLPANDSFERDVRGPPRHANTLPSSVQLDPFKPSFDEADVSDKPFWFATQYPSLTTTKIDNLNRQYRHRIEALRALDDMIGVLKQHLVSSGTWDNTLLIFTSDNGWLYGEHRTVGKVLAYEESIRVPLLLRGPGIPANTARNAMVLNNDLAPTLAALGGATPGLTCDGRSLAPLFTADNPPDWRRRFLVEHYRDAGSAPVSFADYLAVRTATTETSASGAQRTLVDWRYQGHPYGVEHYNLVNDPYQLNSLTASSGADAAERAALNTSLALLRHCGKPGYPSCGYAEFTTDEIFLDGFE
ncbi:sulfatase [Dokdonella soli]|uniref:Sulfatase n=1 Tax=Dokdonella soli TaxID=529810 RepID=A0ABN1IYF8_9GAMM